MKKLIEVSAYSVEWAIAAAKAGAARIELCENISEGGTTPSIGTIKQCIKHVKIPVLPIIRPRGGNFVYTDAEFESMKEDIRMAKDAGASGVVFGILNAKDEIDKKRNRELLELARPLEVSCHRAFDITPDPEKALDDLIEIGFDRVLTSGQKMKAELGISLISKLVERAAGRIIIMPGAGINSFNILNIARKTRANEFHLTAKKVNWEHPLTQSSEICFSAPGTRLYIFDYIKVKDVLEKLKT